MSETNKQPMEVHLEIASQCFLRCVHCSTDATPQAHRYAPLSEVVTFLRVLSGQHQTSLWITGGEPLALAGVAGVVRRFSEESGVWQIGTFTSGCVQDESGKVGPLERRFVEGLKRAGLSCCYVSLYSDSAEGHEAITLVEGSFSYALRSIDVLRFCGIEVRINCPVLRMNAERLSEIASYCERIGASEVRFLRLVPHGRATGRWTELALEPVAQRIAIEFACTSLAEKGSGIRLTVAGFPDAWDCRPTDVGPRCQAGIRLFYIDCAGDVYPCACKKRDRAFRLGNVSESALSQLVATRATSDYWTRCMQDQ
jgi:MoaA/NifB/PqqE/SkfB family radical SAM enzyme